MGVFIGSRKIGKIHEEVNLEEAAVSLPIRPWKIAPEPGLKTETEISPISHW